MPTRSSSSHQSVLQGFLVLSCLLSGFYPQVLSGECLGNESFPAVSDYNGSGDEKSSTADLGLPVLYLLDTVNIPFVDDFSVDRFDRKGIVCFFRHLFSMSLEIALLSIPSVELSFETMHTDTACYILTIWLRIRLIVSQFHLESFSGKRLDVRLLPWIRSICGLSIIDIRMTP